VRDRDGNERWLLSNKVPVRDVNGEIIGLVEIKRDITEEKRAREALLASERLFRMLIENSSDVVLMDFMTPELNGLDATARVVAKFPAVRVIVLSMNSSEEHVLQSLRAGASGYLLKNISPAEMERSIREVARGETHVTPAVAKCLVAAVLAQANPTSLNRLTTRQREVLQLVAEGNTTKQIAHKLSVGVKTAETHRTELMRTLDIHDTAGLVRYAIRAGVIQPDP
jgi:DNA-binding NarL/FixJ family response regulator